MTEKEAIEVIKKRLIGISPSERIVRAVNMAITALEEIQQYRAIETEIREQYHANVDIKELVQCFIETIFKGEKHEGFCILTNEDAKMWEEYRAIGTVEECREARERQKGKKCQIINGGITVCPICGAKVLRCYDFCKDCGQAIDWRNEN